MKKEITDFDKTQRSEIVSHQREEERVALSTREMPRESLTEEIPVERRAYLQVKVKKNFYSLNLDNIEVVIGRSEECQIQVPNDGISRMHARIFFANEEYYIEDLDSTNGTFVNNIKVIKCVLRNHDLIEIGDANLIFIEEKIRLK